MSAAWPACRSVRSRSTTRWRSISAWKIVKATEADLGADAVDPRQKKLLADMVEKHGRLGRKNGKGFYDYPEKWPKRLWPGLADLQKTKLDPDKIDVAELKSAAARHAGAGDRALLRGRRADRRARGRCRLDSRVWLCPVLRRHPVLYRHDGDQKSSSNCARSSRRNSARASSPNKLLVEMAGKGESFYGRFAPGKKRAAA